MNPSQDHLSHDSFYITGGTLPLHASSYVPRHADIQLLDGLQQGHFCYVLNTRQMGKSSLMIRTALRLQEQGCRVAILDLTAIGHNLSVDQWYFGLLGNLALQVGREDELLDFWRAHREWGPMQRFVEALRRILLVAPALEEVSEPDLSAVPVRPLVVFVDEIDAVRSLPFSVDEFFAGIRECYNRRTHDPAFSRLTFCLLGVAAPTDLIRDTRISPFNIGKRIELSDFTPEEAEPLARGLIGGDDAGPSGSGRRVGLSGRALRLLRRILHWTGGHPYMTQRLCQAVAARLAEGAVSVGNVKAEEALVDDLCARLFLSKVARETDDNLAFVRNRLLSSEGDVAALLDLYGQVRAGKRVRDDETNPLCAILRLSGVVAREQGLLTLRNRIYDQVFDRTWVQSNIPTAELQRQRQAYRRGVMRAMAFAASVLAVVSLLAYRAIVSDRRSQRLTLQANTAAQKSKDAEAYSDRLLYATRMNLLQHAYEDEDLQTARILLEETRDRGQGNFEWRYWNRLIHQELFTIAAPGPRSLMVWSRDGRWIVTQTQDTIDMPHLDLWDAGTGQHVRTLPGRATPLVGVESPVAATRVALVAAPLAQAGKVDVIDPRTGALLYTLPGTALEATLSADGRRVFTLEAPDKDHRLLGVWNAENGKCLYKERIDGAHYFGLHLLWSTVQSTADSRLLAFGSNLLLGVPYFLTLLDATTGAVRWKSTSKIAGYAVSPLGRYLAVVNGFGLVAGQMRLYDLQTQRSITLEVGKHRYTILCLKFSPDERQILGTGGDPGQPGKVWLWDTVSGRDLHNRQGQLTSVYNTGFSQGGHSHRAVIEDAYFSPDGKRLFTYSPDNSVRSWDVATGSARGIYPMDPNVIAISPDRSRFLVGDRQTVQVYSMKESKPVAVHSHPYRFHFQFDPDGRHLTYTAADLGSLATDPRAWEENFAMCDMASDHEDYFRLPRNPDHWVTPDGSQLWVPLQAPHDGIAAEIRDTHNGKVLDVVHNPERLAPIGENFNPVLAKQGPVTVSKSGLVQVWDTRTRREIMRLPRTRYKIVYADSMQSGRKIFCFDDKNIVHVWGAVGKGWRELYAWNLDTGSGFQMREDYNHESPDGRYFCAVLYTMSAYYVQFAVFDIDTGKRILIRDNAAFANVFFSPDSHYALWGDLQQNAHITDLITGKDVLVLPSLGGDYQTGSWSADGKRIVTGTANGICKLWDVATGSELMRFRGMSGPIWQLGFAPGGDYIVATEQKSDHYTVHIWSAGSGGANRPAVPDAK